MGDSMRHYPVWQMDNGFLRGMIRLLIYIKMVPVLSKHNKKIKFVRCRSLGRARSRAPLI